MEDQLRFIVPAGLIAIPAGIYFWRCYHGVSAGLLWSLAWLALWLTGLLEGTADQYPLLRLPAHLTAVVFASLMLAGAYRFTLRSGPRWLPALYLTACLAVSVPMLLGKQAGNLAVSIVTAFLILGAAGVVARYARRSHAGLAERFLGPALVFLALLSAFNWVRFLDADLRDVLLSGWFAGGLSTVLLQLLIFGERSRILSQRLHEERELLRLIAHVMGDEQAPWQKLARVLGETQYLDLFLAFGAWARVPGGDDLEYLGGHLPGEFSLPPILLSSHLDRPILQAALHSETPLFLENLSVDPRVSEQVKAFDVDRGFIAPLRDGGEVIGVMGAILDPELPLDESQRRFIGDLADEISLVLSNLRLREQQRGHAEVLDAERRQLRGLIEAVPEGILLTDRDGRIRIMNRRLCDQLRISEPEQWRGRLAQELPHLIEDHVVEPLRDFIGCSEEGFRANRDLSLDSFELQLGGDSGTILLISSQPVLARDGLHLGHVWVSRDVTEERRMGQLIQHAERMQTVGTLAGGLAHDFNNNLTAILGNAELIRPSLAAESASRSMLDDLERAAEHCADLTGGLLTFARRDSTTSSPVEMVAAVSEVEALLRPSMPPEVVLDVAVEEKDCWVQADAHQLRRVLTNLIVNARDAVGREGHIQVRVQRLPNEKDAAGLEILVIDDGPGMDEDTRRRIFDPFFTTKERGRGTGLGLAIVYGIVERHAGSITVSSAPGQGTTFRVTWPALEHAPADVPRAAQVSAPRVPERRTLLLAEDESALRRLARTALESAGYAVIEAEDGEAAITLFRAHRDEISAAIFDLSMPRRNGLEALEVIREEEPGLPAMIVSGHPDREQQSSWPADIPLLTKPYGPSALLDQVSALLAREAGAPRSPTNPS